MSEPSSSPTASASGPFLVVLTGNPNCGKTTLFNALTGLRAKVGNYAGVTVERKEGRLTGVTTARPVTILDLPGTYSLTPQSVDEQIARDVLLQREEDVGVPGLVIVVVDASNLERNLYFATQVIELGYPTVLALNMIDVARQNGHTIDAGKLSQRLGVPVVPLIASVGDGLGEVRKLIADGSAGKGLQSRSGRIAIFPKALEQSAQRIQEALPRLGRGADRIESLRRAESLLLLGDPKYPGSGPAPLSDPAVVLQERERLEGVGLDWRSAQIEARYAAVGEIQTEVLTVEESDLETPSDRLDRVLTDKVWGTLVFVGVMALIFQTIFSFAQWPMDALQGLVDALGGWVGGRMAEGDLRSLLVDGVIAGVGAVVVFLPQILLLFLFIGLLEDTGYMARAAFLMDRLMSKVGLHGKSFIPMLSSFACAIPGIMATRTIETPKDRLVTILVAPLMSCSARLPVYTLLIAACIPETRVFGLFGLPALTMLGMYLLGIVVALVMAWIFKSTLLKGHTPMLIMELPPYRRPVLKVVIRHMWERSKLFLRRAGTVILGINILLWFLATYPKDSEADRRFEQRRTEIEQAAAPARTAEEKAAALKSLEDELAGSQLRHSFAGRLGHLIEPAIRPLGFDWKIGIGIVASFAAREVFVSTMSTVYNVGAGEADEVTEGLARLLKEQRREDGRLLYTPLVGVTLMVFYVFALQCVSTIAVVRRETNGWRWPVFQFVYMGALAWGLAFVVYQGGRLLGFAG